MKYAIIFSFLMFLSMPAWSGEMFEECSLAEGYSQFDDCINNNFETLSGEIEHVELEFEICSSMMGATLASLARCTNDNFKQVREALPHSFIRHCGLVTPERFAECVNDNFEKIESQM